MRWAVWLIFASVACAGGARRQEPSVAPPSAHAEAHVTKDYGVDRARTTEESIMERLRDVASTIPEGAAAARIALGDLAYPKDEAENEAMAGYALLLVTSVTKDADELPLLAVKVHSPAGELPLGRAARRKGEVTDAQVRDAFGPHRTDELYYFPVALTRLPCKVVVDFAKNRQNFELMTFPPPPDADGLPEGLEILDPGSPDARAATELAKREFGWSVSE